MLITNKKIVIKTKNLSRLASLIHQNPYSEVPANRRAVRNKRAGLGKNSTLPAFLLSKLINEQGGIFLFITWKIASRVERKSEKFKRACISIREFRVVNSRQVSDFQDFFLIITFFSQKQSDWSKNFVVSELIFGFGEQDIYHFPVLS